MLDASIAQIRSVVFALSAEPGTTDTPVRYRLLDLASEYGSVMSSAPTVSFNGAVDLLVRADLADDVVAVAREALANVAKHARAKTASLSVLLTDDAVTLEVVDDGVGLHGSTRRSGLANLEQRAAERGGRLQVDSDAHGTRLRWIVPLARH
jgi:signal transduction histidine kinase